MKNLEDPSKVNPPHERKGSLPHWSGKVREKRISVKILKNPSSKFTAIRF